MRAASHHAELFYFGTLSNLSFDYDCRVLSRSLPFLFIDFTIIIRVIAM